MTAKTPELKAERRELKKRPRMPVHGRALKKASKYAGKAAAKWGKRT